MQPLMEEDQQSTRTEAALLLPGTRNATCWLEHPTQLNRPVYRKHGKDRAVKIIQKIFEVAAPYYGAFSPSATSAGVPGRIPAESGGSLSLSGGVLFSRSSQRALIVQFHT